MKNVMVIFVTSKIIMQKGHILENDFTWLRQDFNERNVELLLLIMAHFQKLGLVLRLYEKWIVGSTMEVQCDETMSYVI